jgi:hypothetical protein
MVSGGRKLSVDNSGIQKIENNQKIMEFDKIENNHLRIMRGTDLLKATQ